MLRLIRELIRPYRGTLLIILIAMLVETAVSLAGPWPLKIIIDNVIGNRKLPLRARRSFQAHAGAREQVARRRPGRGRLRVDRSVGGGGQLHR